MQYFAYAMSGKYKVDSRIASFVTIDSPLNDVKLPVGGAGQPATLGTWLSANTRITTGQGRQIDTALTVDAPQDVVNHRAVSGIEYEGNPKYPKARPRGSLGLAQ